MVGKFFFGLNWLVAVALIGTSYAGTISPETNIIFAFLGLGYLLTLLTNVAFTLTWLYKRSLKAALSITALIFTFTTFSNHVSWSGSQEVASLPTDSVISFKVMSYNVRVFDLYNWSAQGSTKDSILAQITNHNPSITCLQEFYDRPEERSYETTRPLQKMEIGTFSHIHFTSKKRTYDSTLHRFGLATFSRYEIVNKGVLTFESGSQNAAIYSDLAIGIDTIRVYNTHLASLKFNQKDYAFLGEIMDQKSKENIARSKKVLSRIKTGFTNRAKQADKIRNHIAECRYPVIVCGDFNDTPGSYAYNTIRGELKDAFLETSVGLGSTYAGKIPGLRIDHVFSDESIIPLSFQIDPKIFSDHKAIVAELAILK